MTQVITLDLSTAPVSEAALALAAYYRGVAVSTAAWSYTHLGSGRVRWTGAADDVVICYTDPSGVRRRWPSDTEPAATTRVVLALTATGLTASDIDLTLTYQGVAQTQPTLTEISGGDYYVTLPALSAGTYAVMARFAGMAWTVEVVEPAAALAPSLTLSARGARLSRTVAHLGEAWLTFRRRHSMTNRTGAPLATLLLDGIHAISATSLTLKEPAGGSLRGRLPKGITLTIAGTDYTTSATADVTVATDRLLVGLSSGLVAEAADDAVVTLADYVEYTVGSATDRCVRLSGLSAERRVMLYALSPDVRYQLALPGHKMPEWVQDGDILTVVPGNGYPIRDCDPVDHQPTEWGQRVVA